MRYFGGVPVGSKQHDEVDTNSRYNSTIGVNGEVTSFVNNHWNIEVWFKRTSESLDTFVIVRVVVEAFSVQQIAGKSSSQVKMASCEEGSSQHTSYDMLTDIPPQPLLIDTPIAFTYDIIWRESPDVPYKNRWGAYLSMDDAVPNYVEFSGFFLGVFILVALSGILFTWVLRDLSYKPIVDQVEECSDAETEEIRMWPLSTRLFFAPRKAPILLCIACGTGAQLLSTSFCFIVLFRTGIISQSQKAQLLTPGIVLYSLSSVFGGYVTGRLSTVFHIKLKIALASSLVTAIAYPLLGLIVVFFAYDVFPKSDAPNYEAASNILPMVVLWLFFVWPLTLICGFFGFSNGPIQNFPVSEGSTGYHDLNLQDDPGNLHTRSAEPTEYRSSCWRTFTIKHRIAILLVAAGFFPCLSCFVSYSYGIAGPILLGYFSVRPYMIASYLLFILSSGVVAALLFYRQLRTQHLLEWWWAAFATSGSTGIYIFVLSMSYILFRGSESHLDGSTIATYLILFAYLSFGVLLMNGFVGVAFTLTFIRTVYTYIVKRQQESS
jgi:transmembrane 9 superfamily member 2/4